MSNSILLLGPPSLVGSEVTLLKLLLPSATSSLIPHSNSLLDASADGLCCSLRVVGCCSLRVVGCCSLVVSGLYRNSVRRCCRARRFSARESLHGSHTLCHKTELAARPCITKTMTTSDVKIRSSCDAGDDRSSIAASERRAAIRTERLANGRAEGVQLISFCRKALLVRAAEDTLRTLWCLRVTQAIFWIFFVAFL